MSDHKQPQTSLRSIYEEGGSMPDMSKLDRDNGPRWAKSFGYFVGIIVLTTVVAWLGFRLFIPSNPGDVVSVAIDAPDSVTAGAKMTVRVRYENQDNSPLALAVLKVRYPKEFVAESVTPRSDDDTLTSWTLGSVDRGGSGIIEIQGRALGNIGTAIQLQSTLTYKPSSFNAEFTALANKTVAIDAAPVELTFDGPAEASAGQSITFTVRYKNSSDAPLTNAQLVFAPGTAFSMSKSSKPVLKNTTWALPPLEPGVAGELTITGAVTSSAEEKTVLPFRVVTQLKREEVILSTADYALAVTQGDLGVTVERDNDAPVRMGEAISGRIVVANNASIPLGDITVQLMSTSGIEWARSTSSMTIASTKGGVTWTPASAPALKNVPATERVTIPFTVKAPTGGDVASILLSATAKALKRDGKAVTLVAKSADMSVPVGSHIGADATALYYDGAGVPLGGGPLPPRVGEETKYRIVWKINNGSRDLADVTLTAVLPENVSFGQKQGVGAGAISFDAESRTVRWAISRLPSNVPEVIAQFDVVLLPTVNDQGSSVELVGAGTLSAVDPLLTDPVTVAVSRLTTDLSRDAKASGRGAVLP